MKNWDFSKAYQPKLHSRTIIPSKSTQFINFRPTLQQLQSVTSQLIIPRTQLDSSLLIYEWRTKTELPIPRVHNYTTVRQHLGKFHINVTVEKFSIRLYELTELPLFKLIYLMKESLIGFQRLFDKFGAFPITPRMIALNQQNKCKVWLNQSFQSNDFTNIPVQEGTLVKLLFKIFEESSNRLKSTSSLFHEIEKCKSFCEALNFIDTYTRENKISIPSCCRVLPKEIVVKSTHNEFNPSLSMNKTTKFIPGSLRISLDQKSSKSFFPFRSSTRNVENDEEDKQMKSRKSGQTAPDVDQSRTISGQNHEDKHKFELSHIFDKKKDKANFIFQSTVPKKGNFPASEKKNPNYFQKLQFTSQCIKTQSKPSFLSNLKDKNASKNELSNEEQDIKMMQNEVFQKNQWRKSIRNLVNTDQQDVKCSVHMGKQQFKTQDNNIKLQFLDKLGKQVHQSFIHTYTTHEHGWHPSTTQF